MWSFADCFRLAFLCAGISNIEKIYNCFTRVHVAVKNLDAVSPENREKLKRLPLVKSLLVRGNEIQLVIGMESKAISAACNKHLGIS
ncbi:MAG: PTS transporter subunit EIIB [Treponema sp.]|nr:PTS transporter subunit EIIB [Treponema sp.]